MNVRSFLGSEPSKGSGSRSLGLADEEFDLTRLLIALARELASASLSTGSLCAELGCAEDIGAGDAGGIAGVELPDGSSKVNSSCARAFWAVRVFRIRGSVGMKRVVGWMFEYTVRVCALHHSTGSSEVGRGQTSASARALRLPTIAVRVFQIQTKCRLRKSSEKVSKII